MTTFTTKNWKDSPDVSTPISAAALKDLETRVTSSGGRTITPNSSSEDPLTLANEVGDDLHTFTNIAGAGHQAGAHYWHGDNGLEADGAAWVSAIDVGASTPYRDLVLAAKSGYPGVGSVTDFVYASHNGASAQPTLGIGPGLSPSGIGTEFTLVVKPDGDDDATVGNLRLIKHDSQTGDIFAITSSGALPGSRQIWVEDDYQLTVKSSGTAPLTVKNNGDTELLKVLAANGTVKVPFSLALGAGAPDSPSAHIDVVETSTTDSILKLRTASNAHLELRANGDTADAQISTQNASTLSFSTNGYTPAIKIGTSGELGFYNHAVTAQQVLATGTGKSVDNVITALQNLGLVKQA